MSIPARLEAAKARDNIGDAKAADKFGVTQQTFNKWRRGKQRPEEDQLPAIAEWTGTDLGVLRGEWHDQGAAGGLTAEQAESLGGELHTLALTLNRIADRIEKSLDQAVRKDDPAGRSRQRVH